MDEAKEVAMTQRATDNAKMKANFKEAFMDKDCQMRI